MPSTYEYHEPTVPLNSAPPPGYRLVPKGNPYMTLNCRKQTHLAGQTVYNVVEKPGGKHMGIRVPQTVYNAVAASFAATKSDRADAVRRRDGKLEATYLETVLAAFPKAPRREVDAVVSRAMKKHSGRVGRTGQLSAQEKAVLGVLAHIRHVHSPYEKLLKQGVPRLDARRQSEKEIAKKAAEWGYTRQLRGSGASRRKGASQKAKMRKPARIPAANPSKAPSGSEKNAGKRKRKRNGAQNNTKTLAVRTKTDTDSVVAASPDIQPIEHGTRRRTRSMAQTSRQAVSQRGVPDHISISSDDESVPDGDEFEGSDYDDFAWISSDDELIDKNESYDEDEDD